MSGRSSVIRGDNIILDAVFLDAAGNATDPTDLSMSVYPPGKDPRLGATPSDAWVYGVTVSSGGSGPYASPTRTLEKEGTGQYQYTFPVPSDADLGPGFDRWEGTVDGEELDETFAFVIVGGGSISTNRLYENNIVYIKLAETIAATDGTTLGEETTRYFTTTYNPLYSSIRKVRLDLGPLIQEVYDDTINFAIFEASLSADANAFVVPGTNVNYYNFARRNYVTCLAELTLVEALLGDRLFTDRMYKKLGDLSIARGENNALLDKSNQLRDCVARWEFVIQNAGNYSPENSLGSQYAVKGSEADDAIQVRRQWEPTSGVGVNTTSAANTYTTSTTRRRQRTYRRRG